MKWRTSSGKRIFWVLSLLWKQTQRLGILLVLGTEAHQVTGDALFSRLGVIVTAFTLLHNRFPGWTNACENDSPCSSASLHLRRPGSWYHSLNVALRHGCHLSQNKGGRWTAQLLLIWYVSGHTVLKCEFPEAELGSRPWRTCLLLLTRLKSMKSCKTYWHLIICRVCGCFQVCESGNIGDLDSVSLCKEWVTVSLRQPSSVSPCAFLCTHIMCTTISIATATLSLSPLPLVSLQNWPA